MIGLIKKGLKYRLYYAVGSAAVAWWWRHRQQQKAMRQHMAAERGEVIYRNSPAI
jgi:hypothetical protein